MDFKKITCGQTSYGDESNPKISDIEHNKRTKVTNVDFRDKEFFNELSNNE